LNSLFKEIFKKGCQTAAFFSFPLENIKSKTQKQYFSLITLAVIYQLNIVQLAYLFLSTKISAAPQGFPRIKKS